MRLKRSVEKSPVPLDAVFRPIMIKAYMFSGSPSSAIYQSAGYGPHPGDLFLARQYCTASGPTAEERSLQQRDRSAFDLMIVKTRLSANGVGEIDNVLISLASMAG